MARSYTQVAPDSTGDKISTDEKIDGLGNTVQEQIIRLAGAAIDEVADVRNTTPGASDMGMVVRAVGGGDVTALTDSTGAAADAAATAGAVGTIQAKLRLMTSQLSSILTSVDGLEGFTDGLEGLITSLGALVDGLEASIGTTADAAAVAGDVGTIQAKLRIATSLFNEIDVAIVALQGLVGITSAAASAVGGEGNLTAKLRLMTSQLDAITTGIALIVTRLNEIKAATAAAVTSVPALASNGTLLAANAARRMAAIYNNSAAFLYLKHGAIASTISFTVKIPPFKLYELTLPVYPGVIDGIWDSATGAALVTETT